MEPAITLDVVVSTYNRADLLELTLQSLLCAEIPAGLTVCCILVDNNSTDHTRELAMRFVDEHPDFFRYLLEMKQGKSFAVNAGIAATHGDWIGMIDDDEEISPTWFRRIYEEIQKPGVDFFGGPYLPRFESEPPPRWLTKDRRPLVGWLEGPGPPDREFKLRDGMTAPGGNVVIKRAVLDRVGKYDTDLGRTNKGMLSGEDTDMHNRLLRAGARGFWIHDLTIYHYIPNDRLKTGYHVRRFFGIGISRVVLLRKMPDAPTIGRIPRWLLWRTVRILPKALYDFDAQLRVVMFAGFVYGSYFRTPTRTPPTPGLTIP